MTIWTSLATIAAELKKLNTTQAGIEAALLTISADTKRIADSCSPGPPVGIEVEPGKPVVRQD